MTKFTYQTVSPAYVLELCTIYNQYWEFLRESLDQIHGEADDGGDAFELARDHWTESEEESYVRLVAVIANTADRLYVIADAYRDRGVMSELDSMTAVRSGLLRSLPRPSLLDLWEDSKAELAAVRRVATLDSHRVDVGIIPPPPDVVAECPMIEAIERVIDAATLLVGAIEESRFLADSVAAIRNMCIGRRQLLNAFLRMPAGTLPTSPAYQLPREGGRVGGAIMATMKLAMMWRDRMTVDPTEYPGTFDVTAPLDFQEVRAAIGDAMPDADTMLQIRYDAIAEALVLTAPPPAAARPNPGDNRVVERPDSLAALDPDALLTHADIAAKLGLDKRAAESLRQALNRWRKRNPGDRGWKEVEDRLRNDSRYLYRVSAVLPVIRRFISSGKRPAKNISAPKTP